MSAIQLFDRNGELRFDGTSAGGGGSQAALAYFELDASFSGFTELGATTMPLSPDPAAAVVPIALLPTTVKMTAGDFFELDAYHKSGASKDFILNAFVFRHADGLWEEFTTVTATSVTDDAITALPWVHHSGTAGLLTLTTPTNPTIPGGQTGIYSVTAWVQWIPA